MLMNVKRLYVLKTFSQYWQKDEQPVSNLSMPVLEIKNVLQEFLPPEVALLTLPDWAQDIGVNGKLLVPLPYVLPGSAPAWARTDWLSVMFWYLNGLAERAYEKKYGPVHSYASRLNGWNSYIWERAWVNRIALFLRRWAAQEHKKDEAALFGALPSPKIFLTHDVDAVTKTLAIRFKQAAFLCFNAFKHLPARGLYQTAKEVFRAAKFFSSAADYWHFDDILRREQEKRVRSCFYVYGGRGGWNRSPVELLFDPSYTVSDARLSRQLYKMHEEGWDIGLHPSFNSWRDARCLRAERKHVEKAVGIPITVCRQHWLRFSWEHTWKAQEEAGFKEDATLGFNDRPAFRNGSAVCFHPWNMETGQPMGLQSMPMVLMDSHLYDYANAAREPVPEVLDRWLQEIRFVRGTASILWHQQVMGKDYGWADGFQQLLDIGEGLFSVGESPCRA